MTSQLASSMTDQGDVIMISKKGRNIVGCMFVGQKEDGLNSPKQGRVRKEDRIEEEAMRICKEVRAHLKARQNDPSAKEDALDFIKALAGKSTISCKVQFYSRKSDNPIYPKRLKPAKDKLKDGIPREEDHRTLEDFLCFIRYLDIVTKARELAQESKESFSDKDREKLAVKVASRLRNDFSYTIKRRLEDRNGNLIHNIKHGQERMGARINGDCYEVPELNDFERAIRKQIENIVRRKARLAIW